MWAPKKASVARFWGCKSLAMALYVGWILSIKIDKKVESIFWNRGHTHTHTHRGVEREPESQQYHTAASAQNWGEAAPARDEYCASQQNIYSSLK